jgi:hypothetical protein
MARHDVFPLIFSSADLYQIPFYQFPDLLNLTFYQIPFYQSPFYQIPDLLNLTFYQIPFYQSPFYQIPDLLKADSIRFRICTFALFYQIPFYQTQSSRLVIHPFLGLRTDLGLIAKYLIIYCVPCSAAVGRP